jgi:hypothetical protein
MNIVATATAILMVIPLKSAHSLVAAAMRVHATTEASGHAHDFVS